MCLILTIVKRGNLPLNALRAFEAAGRRGRMTLAAEELFVTHGAVSRQIQHLEQVLGVALFAGPRSRPELTAVGHALLPALSAAFGQIENAVQTAMRAESAVLDVACLSTFLMRWLIPRLHQFHALHPEIDLRLRALDQSPDSRGEQADLVVMVDEGGEAEPGERLDGLLFKEWLGPVVAPALLERLGPVGKGDLPVALMLETKSRLNAWQMWQSAVGSGSQVPAGPVFEHYYFTLEAALAGLGFCIAPWHLVIAEVQSGRLAAPFGFVESGYAYVARQHRHDSAGTARFRAWLANEASQMPLPEPGRTKAPER